MDLWLDPGPNPMPFRDVPYGVWYYDSVLEAYQAGIVKGTSATTVSPAMQVSRGQLVTMLYRMMGSPKVSGQSGFQDLTAAWYRDAVLWAWQNDIVKGYSDTEFGPDKEITRQELVTILYRHSGSPAVTGDSLAPFSDAGDVSTFAQDAIQWAVGIGILKGSGGKINPKATATRAEACALLMRYRSYRGQ